MQRTYGAPGDPGNRAGRGESLNWTFRTGVRLQGDTVKGREMQVSAGSAAVLVYQGPGHGRGVPCEAAGVIETERVWVTRGALEGWHTLARFGTVSAVHANAA